MCVGLNIEAVKTTIVRQRYCYDVVLFARQTSEAQTTQYDALECGYDFRRDKFPMQLQHTECEFHRSIPGLGLGCYCFRGTIFCEIDADAHFDKDRFI